MKKALIGLLVLVILAAVVGGAMMLAGPREPEVTVVRVQPVERGDLVEIVSAPGDIMARTKVSISAKTSSQIMELPFEEGALVRAPRPDADPPFPGDILVRLDDSDLRSRLRAAQARRAGQEANLAVAEANLRAARSRIAATEVQLADAERDYNRQSALFESSDVSRQAVDDAETRFTQLQRQIEAERDALEADELNLNVIAAQIEAAEAEIQQAEDELEYTVIVAPIDGTITKLNAEEGEIVVTGTMNNAGTVIMEVADLSEMIVEAEVDETDVTKVEVGQPAVVRAAAYGREELAGTVRSVSLSQEATGLGGSAETGSKYYICEVLLDSEATARIRVFSGLTADVEIETQKHQNVVRVPSQAVVGRRVDALPPEMRDQPEVRSDKEFTPVVYRLVNGKAVVTPVEVGPSDLRHTQVVSGLEEGQEIVIGPYNVLESIEHDQLIKTEAAGGTAAGAAATQGS